MPKNSQYKFVFLSVQIKGLSRVMFDGHFIHFYANYSQRNHFGVFLVMQFDRDYNPVQAHRWIDLQWVANVLLIKTTGVSKKKPQDEKLWAVSWIKTISPLVLRHTFNKWNGHVLTVFCVCEGKSGSEAIKKHATVPEEWTTQQFSMQDAELCGTIVSTSRQEIANNNRKQQAWEPTQQALQTDSRDLVRKSFLYLYLRRNVTIAV